MASSDPVVPTVQSTRQAQAERLTELARTAQYAIYDANRALINHLPLSDVYARERGSIDLAVLFCSKAKWHAGRYSGTHMYFAEHSADRRDAVEAERLFNIATDIANESSSILSQPESGRSNVAADKYRDAILIHKKEAEIKFADDVPVVPSVCPIIVISGSSYEMGRQYVEQVIDIFGIWAFVQIAQREFADGEIEIIKKWLAQLETYAPEIPEMARGWVDAAAQAGLQLNFLNVIQLWTGHFEPVKAGILGHGVRDLAGSSAGDAEEQADASYFGGQSVAENMADSNVDLCSGACAWGAATRDRRLIAGSSTDHDCTFQATVVAFPDEGNAFIYTPFSIVGFIPGLGQYFFAGHPGMNNKGLAYIHHGGGLHGIEGGSDRGYGLRRGASVFHNLRFASSAREALRNELSWPIGDVGSILGSVGGFYADASYGYVCEARPSLAVGADPIIREVSFDEAGRSYDFLYANNNSVHPRSSGGFAPAKHGYQFNVVEGWIEDKPASVAHLGERQLASALSTKSSQGRNRYLFEALHASYGHIDLDGIVGIYSTSAPERYRDDGQRMSHREREIAWATGAPWPSSVCHRVNAFTAVMQPDDGDQGIYMGCIGPANRNAIMHIPGHGYYYYDETNEFWEIRLRRTPEELLGDARASAAQILERVESRCSEIRIHQPEILASGYFDRLLEGARDAFATGEDMPQAEGGSDAMRHLSRALRRFTECQVRAKQCLTELARCTVVDEPPRPSGQH